MSLSSKRRRLKSRNSLKICSHQTAIAVRLLKKPLSFNSLNQKHKRLKNSFMKNISSAKRFQLIRKSCMYLLFQFHYKYSKRKKI